MTETLKLGLLMKLETYTSAEVLSLMVSNYTNHSRTTELASLTHLLS